MVCMSRESGGLGINDIESFNMALLGKWAWRLGTNEIGLWRDIIGSKYGSWRNLSTIGCNNRVSKWWKDLSTISSMGEGRGRFHENIR